VLEFEIVIAVIGEFVVVDVGVVALVFGRLDGWELVGEALDCGLLALEEVQLALQIASYVRSKSFSEGLELSVEGVGGCGEGFTEAVEDVSEVLVEGVIESVLALVESAEVGVDISWGESLWWDVWRSVHGFLLGLYVTVESDEFGGFGDPFSLLGLLVVSEVLDGALGGVVVVAKVVASKFGGLAVDSSVECLCSSFVLLNHLVERLGEVDELANTTTSSFDTI